MAVTLPMRKDLLRKHSDAVEIITGTFPLIGESSLAFPSSQEKGNWKSNGQHRQFPLQQ